VVWTRRGLDASRTRRENQREDPEVGARTHDRAQCTPKTGRGTCCGKGRAL
jgi:hypothetical protein